MKKLPLLLLFLLFAGNAIAQCVANFTESATPHGSVALEHTFTNLSSSGSSSAGKAVYTTMIFGDGNSYFGNAFWISVAHNYAAPGTYTAKLTIAVYDSVSATIVCNDTMQKTVTVAYSPCSFITSKTKINDSTYSFSATARSTTSALSYTWHFGDGTSATGANPTHTYSLPGYYTVNVTSNGTGCTDSGIVYVSAQWAPPFTCSNVSKSMYISLNQHTAYVTTYATTSPAYSGLVKSFTYNYGDGSATTTSAQHAYSATGVYHVSAYFVCTDSITSAVLCRDTLRDTVNVTQVPGPCAFTSTSTKLNDSTFSFAATSFYSSSALSYTWNFGDGTTGTGANPTHTYAQPGYYIVNVTSTGTGCTDTNIRYAYAHWIPPFTCSAITKGLNVSAVRQTAYANSFAYTTSAYPGLQMQFVYDYGDGSGISVSNVHAYSAIGTYQIKAYFACIDTLSSNVLCRDTLTDSVVITQLYSNVYGYINYDSATYTGVQSGIKVYLIVHDTAAGTLTAVDSTTVSGAGWIPYNFLNVSPGRYLVKAAWPSASTSGTGIVPTYADSSLFWSTARSIYHNGVNNSYSFIIYMRSGTVTSGPGFIGGSVALGANKGAAAGAPGVSMILRDMSGKLIAMAETDAQGRYAFNNVPAGTYTVMPELLNYNSMQSAPVTVSASSTTVSGLNFTKDDQKMNIRSSALGVSKAGMPLISIAPVPARDFIRITAGKDITAATPLEIRDLSGKVLLRSGIQPGSILMLDIRSLPAGMYFVEPGAGAPVKLVVQ
jgi:PKD repeat protein